MKKLTCILWIVLWIAFVSNEGQAVDIDTQWGQVHIHGFLSQGYLQSDQNNFYTAKTVDGTFQFDEVGINFSTDLTDRLHVGMQFLSRDLGNIGNNDVELDFAFGDYRWRDWLGLRVGKIKVPYGLYNETRDIDMLRTSIFLPPSLYAEESRDAYNAIFGAGIYGYVPLRGLGSLNYQVVFGEEDIALDGGLAKSIELHPVLRYEEFTIKNIRIMGVDWQTPCDGLRLATWLGKYEINIDLELREELVDDIPEGTEIIIEDEHEEDAFIILSAEYNWEDVILAAEYLEDDEVKGYYGSLSYRVADWLEFGAYYSVVYPDKDDKKGEEYEAEGYPDYLAWQKDFALTTRFDINEYWTLKLEGHLVNGCAEILWHDNPGGVKEHSVLFAVKATYNF